MGIATRNLTSRPRWIWGHLEPWPQVGERPPACYVRDAYNHEKADHHQYSTFARCHPHQSSSAERRTVEAEFVFSFCRFSRL